VSATSALAAAHLAGIRLWLAADGRPMVAGSPETVPAALLQALRAHKPEIVAILRGECCRYCSGGLPPPPALAMGFADGTGAHVPCYEAAEAGR
jgi:hypothetical protein